MKSKAKPKPGGKAPPMASRGYWDATEEQALRDAAQKHGIGAWEKMRHDVDFKVLKCVLARARARNSSATARRAPRAFLRPFTPPTREERARTRIFEILESVARDDRRAGGVFRGDTFFAARPVLGARGRAAERAGARLNAHTARRRRATPLTCFPSPTRTVTGAARASS